MHKTHMETNEAITVENLVAEIQEHTKEKKEKSDKSRKN
jgi:hypothetical protein